MELEPALNYGFLWRTSISHLNYLRHPSTYTVVGLRCWKCSSVRWMISSWNCKRYVGVSWFVVHVLQLLLIRFTQQNSCCTSKTMMKHLQKLDWRFDLPWFSCGYRKCMFVDFLIEYIGLSNHVHYWVVSNVWRRIPISCKQVSLWCLLFDPHRTKSRVRLRKRAT